MTAASFLARVVASLAATFAFLSLPIVIVTVLSRGDLVTLPKGILVFAAFITVLLVIYGLIWASAVQKRLRPPA
jgi:hypothetical protein